jgi:hypothetical protein
VAPETFGEVPHSHSPRVATSVTVRISGTTELGNDERQRVHRGHLRQRREFRLMRADPVALFAVSFFAGVFLATFVILAVDPPEYLAAGVGSVCSAAVAALIYRKQQTSRW